MSTTEHIPSYSPPAAPKPKRHLFRNSVVLAITLAAGMGIGSAIGASAAHTGNVQYLTVPGKSVTVTTPAGSTTTTPPPPAATTQTASGSGNQVITVAGLVSGESYTVSYTASGSSTNALIVQENSDSFINDINDNGSTLSGSVLYTADAATVTLQVSNADGENWNLTFTPSS